MTYFTFIEPKSIFAGIFRKLMQKDIIKSVEAIKDAAEKVPKKNPTLAEKYKNKITTALSGTKAY